LVNARNPPATFPPLVRMSGITKRFGNISVLKNVRFEALGGEVHVLAGENGAGKSTLIKILAGVHTDFAGRIEIAGREVRPQTTLEASAHGVAVIHQELSLIGPMSVADNIFLGRMPVRGGFVQDSIQVRQAVECVRQLGLDLDVREPVERFSIAVQQLIEIAKALSQKAKVIVMDEPTSALNAPEAERLFALIQSLKERGCGIIYISHKMEEIERIADRITVLRDGEWIGTAPASELPVPRLIEWMVGRKMEEFAPRRLPALGGERLRLDNFSVYPQGLQNHAAAENISLSVRAGEIVGIGGLQGSGASELFHGLSGGYGSAIRGNAYLDGKRVRFTSPREGIEAGVAFLTNDRKATGLVLSLSITANATIDALRELSPGGWRRPPREYAAAIDTTTPMRLRAASLEMEAGALSGGNQQKVAIAKWLQIQPKLLLLDEPTRGIDIGAKREIYQLINEWTARGVAILLITSEMPELLTLSDRIVVMHRGSLSAEFSRASATPEAVLAAAMGSSLIQHNLPIFQPDDEQVQIESAVGSGN
jgi:ribose transport system ATP-binding protein